MLICQRDQFHYKTHSANAATKAVCGHWGRGSSLFIVSLVSQIQSNINCQNKALG